MAQGKKSFLLYCDLRSKVIKLPKEKQADLFMMILDYVNDLDPKTDDLIVDIAFEDIRLQLKRDLKKYESIVERNRENGKKGGRPLKNPENPVGNLETQRNPKKPKKADTDNDTDTDIINTDSHNEIFRKLWNNIQWLESQCMKWKCEKQDLRNHLNTFRQECIDKEEFKVDEKDAKTHFINWVKKGNDIPVGKKTNKSLQENNWW